MTAADNATIQKLVQVLELARRTPLEGSSKNLWHVEEVDLTKANVDLKTGGFGVVALKNGSHPGARVALTLNEGNVIHQFGPGSECGGPFETLRLVREPGSARLGILYLVVLDSPWASFKEGPVGALAPIELLGSKDSKLPAGYTFVAVAAATDPANATPAVTGAFDATGFKKIRVSIDGRDAGVDFSTADLVPFTSPDYTAAAGGTWFKQEDQRAGLTDNDGTANRYRVIDLEVQGEGWMYLAIENMTGANVVGLSFYVQGIE